MASRSLAIRRPGPLRQGPALSWPGPIVAGAAVTLAALVGALLAYDVKTGLAALIVLGFLPVVLLRLPLALCAWLMVVFFARIPGLESMPNRVLVVVAVSWLAVMLLGRDAAFRKPLADWRALLGIVVLFVAWEALTLAWAPAPGAAEETVRDLVYSGLGFALVLSIVGERRAVRWLLYAFVLGAALSVAWGLAKTGLSPSKYAGGEAAVGGRFQGGSGDPNYLAAVLVPAIVLAAGLAATTRSTLQRLGLAGAVAVVAAGLVATQSRGGLLAAGVCCLVAFAVWKGRRRLIAGLVVLFVVGLGALLAASPSALQRIKNASDSGSGSGRVDIWRVAWHVTTDHPLFGVGLSQFPQVSPHYVRQTGTLGYVGLIVDRKIVVHNLYLQLWAETGIVGLLGFLTIVGVSLRASSTAAKRFAAVGDGELEMLSRAAFVALVGVLTASFFLSNISDRRIWVLLALGPVLAGMAGRARRTARAAER
jgi:O-antigen ligase